MRFCRLFFVPIFCTKESLASKIFKFRAKSLNCVLSLMGRYRRLTTGNDMDIMMEDDVPLSQADAKRDFLTVCRRAIQNRERAYVTDRAGERYLTLDPERRSLSGPVLEMTAQFFKDHFSRCSSLIKDGLCFHLTIRGVDQGLFARRHTRYTDPCDTVIDNWLRQVASDALTQKQESDLIKLICRAERHSDAEREDFHREVCDRLPKLELGIARLAIGHRPFEEGRLGDT